MDINTIRLGDKITIVSYYDGTTYDAIVSGADAFRPNIGLPLVIRYVRLEGFGAQQFQIGRSIVDNSTINGWEVVAINGHSVVPDPTSLALFDDPEGDTVPETPDYLMVR